MKVTLDIVSTLNSNIQALISVEEAANDWRACLPERILPTSLWTLPAHTCPLVKSTEGGHAEKTSVATLGGARRRD